LTLDLLRPDVTLIMPTHGSLTSAALALRGVALLAPPPAQIVVIRDIPARLEDAELLPDGAEVVTVPFAAGPARARNAGAAVATSELFLFVDSDVVIPSDTISRVVAGFANTPGVAAIFGSYDTLPADQHFLSQYRNLMHHYVHQSAHEYAGTFWAGLGAIKAEVFRSVGGFDASYRVPCIEDIELGTRLKDAGWEIRLMKSLQGRHIKRWTAYQMLKTDLIRRGIPWMRLILARRQMPTDLNTGRSSRWSVMLVWFGLVAVAGAAVSAAWWFGALLALGGAVGLNLPFYRFLARHRAIRQALWPGAVTTPHSLIEQFHYPRLGPGMMWECFREKVEEHGGAVRTRQEVIEIRYEASRVTSVLLRPAEGGLTTVPLCQVISTMPLDDLILRMRPAPPPVVVEAARALKYRDFILVGLVLRRPSLFADNWLYIHSSRVRVGRIQNFGNWSCDLVPNTGTSSLGMEYFCNRGDAIWTTPDDDLVRLASEEIEVLGLAKRTDLLWGTVIRQPKAYPVYDAHYQRHLTTIRGWLATLTNFQTIGRNGQHRYNNMDHSMLTGLAAVHRLQGQAADPWEINVEESYHEQLDTLKSGAP